jgi:hypothetical protein
MQRQGVLPGMLVSQCKEQWMLEILQRGKATSINVLVKTPFIGMGFDDQHRGPSTPALESFVVTTFLRRCAQESTTETLRHGEKQNQDQDLNTKDAEESERHTLGLSLKIFNYQGRKCDRRKFKLIENK